MRPSGRGVDVAVDAVGAATWPLDFTCVRKGGRVVLCGVTTGAKAESDLRTLYWNQLTILGSTMGSTEDFRQMLRAVTANRLKPVVDRVYRLTRVRDAMAADGDGQAVREDRTENSAVAGNCRTPAPLFHIRKYEVILSGLVLGKGRLW